MVIDMSDNIIDITCGDFFPILNAIDQGILIANTNGVIVFYNQGHAKIDGLSYNEVIGRRITDVYDLSEESSIIMRCLKERRSVINATSLYKTKSGRIVNSIHNAFPIVYKQSLIGAISFVKDYEYLDGLMNSAFDLEDMQRIIRETKFTFRDIIGSNEILLTAINTAKMASNTPTAVMLWGETGTGKELFAQSIHNYGYRRKADYVAVNCAAIPENLLEGILFGTTKGAFTGAIDKPGLIEQADGGTLFLDEINSMPISLQSKLLRVIQEKKVRRVGAVKDINLSLKMISSVNKHPQECIDNGTLRRDLFYRMAVVFIAIPPVRERRDDVGALVSHFIEKYNVVMQRNIRGVSKEVEEFFSAYRWPGNVRELENAIEGAMNMVKDESAIEIIHLSSFFKGIRFEFEDSSRHSSSAFSPISCDSNIPVASNVPSIGSDYGIIKKTLMETGGSVSKAADVLGISRQSLHRKMKRHQIDPRKIKAIAEKEQIEKCLRANAGNVTRAAESLDISRQLLTYKIKKYQIDKVCLLN